MHFDNLINVRGGRNSIQLSPGCRQVAHACCVPEVCSSNCRQHSIAWACMAGTPPPASRSASLNALTCQCDPFAFLALIRFVSGFACALLAAFPTACTRHPYRPLDGSVCVCPTQCTLSTLPSPSSPADFVPVICMLPNRLHIRQYARNFAIC